MGGWTEGRVVDSWRRTNDMQPAWLREYCCFGAVSAVHGVVNTAFSGAYVVAILLFPIRHDALRFRLASALPFLTPAPRRVALPHSIRLTFVASV